MNSTIRQAGKDDLDTIMRCSYDLMKYQYEQGFDDALDMDWQDIPETRRWYEDLVTKPDYGALLAGAIVSFVGSVSVLFLTGRLFGGTGHVWGVFVSWGYTLIPTFFWFLMTSFFYVVLPPPRQQTPLGVLFSVVFMSLSMLLFFWKGILYYLTLRFGMRLDFPRIMGVSAILFPLGVLYALSMYKLGIFRVPFI